MSTQNEFEIQTDLAYIHSYLFCGLFYHNTSFSIIFYKHTYVANWSTVHYDCAKYPYKNISPPALFVIDHYLDQCKSYNLI